MTVLINKDMKDTLLVTLGTATVSINLLTNVNEILTLCISVATVILFVLKIHDWVIEKRKKKNGTRKSDN